MIDLYYWTTPNGHKITMFLEETGLEYKIVPVQIGKAIILCDVSAFSLIGRAELPAERWAVYQLGTLLGRSTARAARQTLHKELFSQGIFVAEIALAQRVVDHSHLATARDVARREEGARQRNGVHRAEPGTGRASQQDLAVPG